MLLWLVFYPLYMHRRAAWGAPRRLALALFATAAFLCGALARPAITILRPPRATVLCKPRGKTMGDGVTCTLRSESAPGDLKVCGDVELLCPGAPAAGSASDCGRVKPDEPAEVVIPFERFSSGPVCEKPVSVQASNVRVDLAE